MSKQIYLDYNASAPMLESVKTKMQAAFDLYGNPSSVHSAGRSMRGAIEEARESLAKLVGARAQDVIWTSGGTEANNLALSPGLFAKGLQEEARLYVSAIEHPAVLNGMRFDKDKISVIPVTEDGIVDTAWLQTELNKDLSEEQQEEGAEPGSRPILVSVMAANNETGIIQPIAQIAEIVHRAGGLLHSDCVQALGKMPITMADMKADLISLSAHKIGGPQGVGALVLKDISIVLRDPLIAGGGQELKRRGGTENVLGIVGFGAAAQEVEQTQRNDQANMQQLRDELETQLLQTSAEVVVFGKNQQRLPNVSCFGVPGFSAETQVIQMDLQAIAISSGSACSSGKVEQSHVLKAMGISDELAVSALRISLGPQTTSQEITQFLTVWQALYHRAKETQAA